MSKLVNNLIREGYLREGRIIDAFSEIGRYEFVPKELRLQAEVNIAIPIGHGRMIPSPLISAFMLELLAPCEGNRVLEIAPGSGWITTLLSYIVGEGGQVIAVERNEALKKVGEENVDKFGYIRKGIARFFLESEAETYMGNEFFDRILVYLEGTEKKEEEIKKQLKIGGKLVALTNDNLIYLERKSEDEFREERYPGFSLTASLVG